MKRWSPILSLSRRFPAIFRLLSEFTRYRGPIAIVLVLGIIVAAVQPICVKLIEGIVNQLQAGVDAGFFKREPVLIVGVFAISGVAKYFYNSIRRYVSEKVIVKLRGDLFRKYLFFPLAITHQKRTGSMLASIQNDLVQVNMGLETVADVLKEPFAFMGLMGVAFYCDWRLALCTLFVAPIVVLLFSQSGAAVKRYSASNLTHFSDLISLGQESIVGAHVVKVFCLEKPLLKKFLDIQKAYFGTLWKSIKVQEISTPAVEFVGGLLIAGVLIYGGSRIGSGAMTTGQLIAFVVAIGLAQMPIKKLNNAYLKMKSAEAAAERIYEVMDLPDSDEQQKGFRRISDFERSIVFEGVTLRYGDKPALQDISFEVKRGESIGFVGYSGSGKSSIVSLLARLYDVTEGKVLFDGVDIREIVVEDLRKLISFVTQETFLFNDSLWENIRYGNPEASDEQIKAAAEQAHCLEFVGRFPRGFETHVGDRGVTLSGGERQRIAIARAILKGAPILVLDEATSNLDSQSEKNVQDALEELMVGKTTFLIAHRFSTVRRANRIYVIEDGRILEQGSHEVLLEGKGSYQRLFEQQTFS